MQHTTQFTPDTAAEPTTVAPEGAAATVQITNNGGFSGRATVPMTPEAKAAQDAAAKATPAAHAVDRPDWIPEKFWKGNVEESAKAMSTSYGELEKAFHAKAKAPEAPATTAAPETPAPTGEEKATLESVLPEFEKSGVISQETFDKLEKAGIARSTAEAFLAGQQALAAQLRVQIASAVGGEERLTKVLEFAKNNPAAAAAYNAAAASKNLELVKLALQGLNAAYSAANPAEPKFVTGTPAPSNGDVVPFGSNAEMVTAMRDKRYATDPAYRESVMRRVAATK